MLNLDAVAEETGRTATSFRAEREKKKLEEAWESSTSKAESSKSRNGHSPRQKQVDWLELEMSKRRGDQAGLLAQTILEDDSEDVF